MGFWSTFRRGPAPAPVGEPALEARIDDAPEARDPVARLALFGDEAGPSEDEALDLLRTARRSSHEGLALDRLIHAHARKHLPRRLVIALASALLDRGDRAAAREVLATSDDPSSLLLRADLLADEGDFAGAIAMIERALLRDLDLPGARERRLTWRARLGLTEHAHRVDPATETVAVPKARAPFDLLREVGRGGAGVVYAATDRELGRKVALKIYHRPERDRGQLLHEARVAVALEGAGIVRVFDVEPEEGWIALEWATLGALRDLLRGAESASLVPLDRWLPGLAHALARVHAAGWIHHDVKPANVLMTTGPEQWLSDFGNARPVGAPSPPGSFGYVSPERLAGRASDARDDVYALGRVIEDVLASVGQVDDGARWRALAARCIGADDTRPRDGAAVVAILGGQIPVQLTPRVGAS
jgi:hypothetical protein